MGAVCAAGPPRGAISAAASVGFLCLVSMPGHIERLSAPAPATLTGVPSSRPGLMHMRLDSLRESYDVAPPGERKAILQAVADPRSVAACEIDAFHRVSVVRGLPSLPLPDHRTDAQRAQARRLAILPPQAIGIDDLRNAGMTPTAAASLCESLAGMARGEIVDLAREPTNIGQRVNNGSVDSLRKALLVGLLFGRAMWCPAIDLMSLWHRTRDEPATPAGERIVSDCKALLGFLLDDATRPVPLRLPDGSSVFVAACARQYAPEIVVWLIEHAHAEVAFSTRGERMRAGLAWPVKHGAQAVHLCAACADVRALDALGRAGHDMDAATACGTTPILLPFRADHILCGQAHVVPHELHKGAVLARTLDVVATLMGYGANVRAVSQRGERLSSVLLKATLGSREVDVIPRLTQMLRELHADGVDFLAGGTYLCDPSLSLLEEARALMAVTATRSELLARLADMVEAFNADPTPCPDTVSRALDAATAVPATLMSSDDLMPLLARYRTGVPIRASSQQRIMREILSRRPAEVSLSLLRASGLMPRFARELHEHMQCMGREPLWHRVRCDVQYRPSGGMCTVGDGGGADGDAELAHLLCMFLGHDRLAACDVEASA